jgi:hypothetical protein
MPGSPSTSRRRRSSSSNTSSRNNNNNNISYPAPENNGNRGTTKARLVIQGFPDPLAGGLVQQRSWSGALARLGGGEVISQAYLVVVTVVLGFLLGQRWFWSFLYKALVSVCRRTRELELRLHTGRDTFRPSDSSGPPQSQQQRLQQFRAECFRHKEERIDRKWIDLVFRYQEAKLHEPAVRVQRSRWAALGRKTEHHQWCKDFRLRTQDAARKRNTRIVYTPKV